MATGIICSLIMRIIGAWVRIFDSHGVLFIGALIGVFVHLPITALIGLAAEEF